MFCSSSKKKAKSVAILPLIFQMLKIQVLSQKMIKLKKKIQLKKQQESLVESKTKNNST